MIKHNPLQKKKFCHFCANDIRDIDYKDTQTLQRFLSPYARILPRRRTGTCSWHQRKLAQAIKRARAMSLLPFTNR